MFPVRIDAKMCDVIQEKKDGVVTNQYVLYKKDGSMVLIGVDTIVLADIDTKIAKLEAQKVELTAVAVPTIKEIVK